MVQLRAPGNHGVEKRALSLGPIVDALGLGDAPGLRKDVDLVDWTPPADEDIDLIIRCIRQAGWVTE